MDQYRHKQHNAPAYLPQQRGNANSHSFVPTSSFPPVSVKSGQNPSEDYWQGKHLKSSLYGLPEFRETTLGHLMEKEKIGDSDPRLVVIGEKNPESRNRRDKEREFCKQKTGSDKYWEQVDFKEAKTDRYGKVLTDSSGNVKEGRDSADPWELKMLELARTIELFLDYARLGIQKLFLLGKSSQDSSTVAFIRESINEALKCMVSLSSSHAHLENGNIGFRWRESNGKEVVQDLRVHVNELINMQAYLYAIVDRCNILPPEKTISGLDEVKAATARVKRIIARNNLDVDWRATKPDISKKRSMAIHQEVNKRWRETGVLKVEDDLRKHLELHNDRKYQLMSRNDFNSQLDAWEKQKGVAKLRHELR